MPPKGASSAGLAPPLLFPAGGMKNAVGMRFALVRAGVLALFLFWGFALSAAVRTNWVDRWVTNSIDVYVPANRYVTEYHTNMVVRTVTNVVEVYATNLVTRNVTNRVQVELVNTNFVQAYHTNYKQLTLTNWATLLVLRTNWVQQTVTNVAVVELPRTEPAAPTKSQAAPPTSPTPAPVGSAVAIEATRGAKQAPKNQVDVRLNVRWTAPAQTAPQSCQWRVQSEDGSILCYGQDPEFRRNLPYGNYNVEVKAQPVDQAQAVSVRGTLSVTAHEVRLLEQRMLAKR